MANLNVNCDFIREGKYFKCIQCGFQIESNKKFPPLKRCKMSWGSPTKPKSNAQELVAEATQKLGIKDKAVHYVEALVIWGKHGFKKRPQEEIDRIYEICKGCERNKDGACTICGCKTNKKGIPLVNKIAMATEECPLGKWGTK